MIKPQQVISQILGYELEERSRRSKSILLKCDKELNRNTSRELKVYIDEKDIEQSAIKHAVELLTTEGYDVASIYHNGGSYDDSECYLLFKFKIQ